MKLSLYKKISITSYFSELFDQCENKKELGSLHAELNMILEKAYFLHKEHLKENGNEDIK